METKKSIAYYCFNRNCRCSVYFSNTIQITDLPLNLATLSADHHCSACNSRLVSMLDIELRQAIAPYKKPETKPAYLRLSA